MISLSDALKKTRRGMYMYGKDWRTLLIVKSERSVPVLWDETKALMDASSMTLESARYITRIMQVASSGTIRIAAISDSIDAYTHVAGRGFTHIIWLYDPEPAIEKYVALHLRSQTIPPELLYNDRAEW